MPTIGSIRTEETTTAEAEELRYWAFASMWAIANIVHLVNQSVGRLDEIVPWANLAAAAFLLARPGSPRRLALLAVSQLAYIVWRSPLAADHAVLTMWANIILLLTYVRIRRRGEVDGGELLAGSLAALRVTVLVAYGAAAIAKYNETFFDPLLSCASFLADTASFGLIEPGERSGWIHIGAAVGPETLIPILLIVPITRRFGVRFGMLFHFLISLSPAVGVWDFTATLFAMFPLFLSRDEIVAAVSCWRHRRDSRGENRLLDRFLRLPRGLRWFGLVLGAGAGGFVSEGFTLLFLWSSFTLYGIRLLIVAVLTWSRQAGAPDRVAGGGAVRSRHDDVPSEVWSPIRPSQIAVVVLMIGYVCMPYLGLRTTGVFTMFSNLRTEGEGSNHYFMPSVHLADYQNDLVVIGESDVDGFEDLAEDGQQIPRIEVQRELSADPGAHVVEVTGDGSLRWGAGGQPVDELDPFVEKTLHFRATAASGEPKCTN